MKVLILEDEPLIALAMQFLVEDEGWSVVGPFSHVESARVVVDGDAEIDCALLDCLVGDYASWPVADGLTRRGVPFAFTSGNDARSIEPRFAAAPVFAKPVDEAAVKTFLRAIAGSR
jgi:DNA-binding response OmpR family regulator